MLRVFIVLNLICVVFCSSKNKNNETTTATTTKSSENTTYPMHIKKQFKKLIYEATDRKKIPFHPAWMDYCDPYHCNDYHKPACGLNRRKMKFRYFQSGCHIILNNMCSNYRGSLKYDMIDVKYCAVYVMFLRMSCPTDCREENIDPVCAYSTTRGHIALFMNQCSLDVQNCKNNTQEYEKIKLSTCKKLLIQIKHNLADGNKP